MERSGELPRPRQRRLTAGGKRRKRRSRQADGGCAAGRSPIACGLTSFLTRDHERQGVDKTEALGRPKRGSYFPSVCRLCSHSVGRFPSRSSSASLRVSAVNFPRTLQGAKTRVKSSGRKLAIASLVVAGATAYMAYLGASSSWQYYMTADECLANVVEAAGRRVRVSGKIAPKTLRIDADRLRGNLFPCRRQGRVAGRLLRNLARQPRRCRRCRRRRADRRDGVAPRRKGAHPLRQQVPVVGWTRGRRWTQGDSPVFSDENCDSCETNRATPRPVEGESMTSLGQVCLLAAMVASGYSAFACAAGGWRRHLRVTRSGVWAGAAAVAALTAAAAVLAWALVQKDFRFEYVRQYSDPLLPWHYSLSAFWVGQAGSLLLWAWMVAVLALAYFFTADAAPAGFRELVFGLLMGSCCFLAGVMVFAADPMQPSAVRPGVRRRPLRESATSGDADSPAGDLPRLCGLGHSLRRRAGRIAQRPLGRRLGPPRPRLGPGGLGDPRRGHPRRRRLGLRGTRLGRLLELGPGRKRLAHALADRHGFGPLPDDLADTRAF